MPAPIPVLIPLLNTNEVEAVIASLAVSEGQPVQAGDVLATLETTKSAADLVAEGSGFVRGLRYREGDTARAGQVFAYLAGTLEEPLPEPAPAVGTARDPHAGTDELPAGLRITQPALVLAREKGLDLSRLPVGALITESILRGLLPQFEPVPDLADLPPVDPHAIIVYGGGGHGRTVIDMLRLLEAYHLEGVIDDGVPAGGWVLDAPVLGGSKDLLVLRKRGIGLAVNAVGGINNIASRLNVFTRLKQNGFSFPTLIHPRAYVEPSAFVDAGAQVFPHAYIGSAARVGFGTIINTGSIVSHDCRIGEMVNISPGAILAGTVEVGDRVLIGMGVTVNIEVKIGAGARIGNGATVKADVPANAVVRAGTIWPE